MMTLTRFIKNLTNSIGLAYVRYLCKKEFKAQKFVSINERPIEYGFVFNALTRKWPQSILDVGTGATALPHLIRTCGFEVTATDNIKDYWPSGMTNRHYHIVNDDIINTHITCQFDVITCISVLEHIPDHAAAVRSVFQLLKPGGWCILTFPYNESSYCKNVYNLPLSTASRNLPFTTQAFSRKEVDTWLLENRADIIKQEYWLFWSGEYWTLGDKILPPIKVNSSDKHQLSCIVLEKKIQ